MAPRQRRSAAMGDGCAKGKQCVVSALSSVAPAPFVQYSGAAAPQLHVQGSEAGLQEFVGTRNRKHNDA